MPLRSAARDAPVSWPPGVLPFLATGGLALGLAVAFVPSTHGILPFNYTLQLGLLLFRSSSGLQTVMSLAVLAHVVEALYTLWVCNRNKLPVGQTSGWTVLVFCVGYPALAWLGVQLKQAATTAD